MITDPSKAPSMLEDLCHILLAKDPGAFQRPYYDLLQESKVLWKNHLKTIELLRSINNDQ